MKILYFKNSRDVANIYLILLLCLFSKLTSDDGTWECAFLSEWLCVAPVIGIAHGLINANGSIKILYISYFMQVRNFNSNNVNGRCFFAYSCFAIKWIRCGLIKMLLILAGFVVIFFSVFYGGTARKMWNIYLLNIICFWCIEVFL